MPRILNVILFLGLALAILAGLHYYVYLRLVRDVALPRGWRIGFGVFLAAAACALPAFVILGRLRELPWGGPWAWLVYLWLGFLFLQFVLLLSGDTFRGFVQLVAKVARPGTVSDPSRRVFVARVLAICAGCAGLGASAWGVVCALRPPRVRNVHVVLAGLPQALAGFTIVQITDLHIGQTVRRAFVADVVRRVNALHPDLIVITGDLVDGSVDGLRADVAPLGELKAPHGVFFVTGNHEYYSGVAEWIEHLTALGIRVLRNERVTIGEGNDVFDLAGVDDSGHGRGSMVAGHGADVAKAMAALPAGRAVVLLAHQPKEVSRAVRHGVGLVLSGHTHGGQIWPWGLLVGLTQPYIAGLHLHEGKTWIYVSCGTGYWGPPMRIATSSEITRVVLAWEGVSSVSDQNA